MEMSKWYHNKEKLKDLFDCITNYILCGVVFYIGVHAIYQKSEIWFLDYAYDFSGSIFLMV